MADSSVPITAGTGTSIDTRTNTTGEHRQVNVIGTDGDNIANVTPWGQLSVTQGPGTVFFDDFSATLDADLWTTTGTAPGVTGGRLVPSATVSTYNAIVTRDVMPNGVGWTEVRTGVQLEATAAQGSGRFWGLGTVATVPAPGVLVQNGAGFEVDQATGNLLAVTYNAGVRTTVGTLTRPTDGNLHAYTVASRVTRTYWMIDGNTVVAATIEFPDIAVADLPIAVVRQNAASFTGTPVFSVTGIFGADSNRDAEGISDRKVGARRAAVSTTGALAVADRPDHARTQVSLTYTATTPPTAETVVSLVPVRSFVAAAGATSTAVTAGKTLQITNVSVTVRTTTTATPWVMVRVRVNPAGPAVVASPQVFALGAGGTAAVAGNSGNASQPVELDLTGAAQLAVSVAGNVATNVVDVTLLGYEV